jgi:small subunit ribosomal protein S17
MRKVRVGSVVRTGMDKTAVVENVWKQRHRLYGKQVRRVARFRVHDPLNQCQLGDVVRIEETRPISKTKHWRILEIVQRRRVADVRPIELESDAEIPETPDAEEQAEQLQDPTEAQDSIEGAAGDSPDDDDDAGAVDTGPGDTER